MLFSRTTSSCIIVLLNWLSDIELKSIFCISVAESTVSDSFFCGEFFLLIILLSAEWPKTSCTGKRRKREGKKRGGKQTENKKQGGVSSDSIYCKSLDSPGTFQYCLVNNLLFPCPSSWSSGGGACCGDSQVCAPWGAAQPPARCTALWELCIL